MRKATPQARPVPTTDAPATRAAWAEASFVAHRIPAWNEVYSDHSAYRAEPREGMYLAERRRTGGATKENVMLNPEGKVAVITSGSSGIGLATARRFVQEGTGSDLVTGKACIQRASDLLRGCRAADTRQVHGTAVLRGGLAPWLKKRLAAYVEANISSNIRVADLAQIARLSLGHFFRAFRQSFGEPPLMYVSKRRVCFAQTLMLSSRAPLSQIALDCGLSDQPHLTRVFRKIVGVTPARWRRQFTQETPPWVVTTHVEAMESLP